MVNLLEATLAEFQMVDVSLLSSHEVVEVSGGCPHLQAMEFEFLCLNSTRMQLWLTKFLNFCLKEFQLLKMRKVKQPQGNLNGRAETKC